MRIAYLTARRQLKIGEAEEPKLSQPDDVLVRIERVGVCGSDVHYYTEGRIGDDLVGYPATVGHECTGSVVEVGPAVKRPKPADRVAVDPAMVCGTCDQCRAGRPNTCRNLQFMGCPGQAPGAMAEYRVVPAGNCFAIPETMSLDQATLVEPLSVGLYAVRLGQVAPAARVAVLGSGPIGLGVLLSAKAVGPCTIYQTDLLDERLAVARRCGADWTGNPKREDVVAAIGRQEPRGLDVVFECSGDPACIDQAQKLLAPGGRLMLVGIPSAVRISFDIHTMRRKELTFANVRRQTGCVGPVIRLIGEGRIDPAPLLTHRFFLEQIQEAFELVAGYGDGVIKAVIDLSTTA